MEKIVFAKSNEKENLPFSKLTNQVANDTWKVIISDDEEQVHEITKLALGHFNFSGRRLEFISAYSAEETIKLISQNPDTAIILQDVVMETDSAGLDVIKFIREELKNDYVRIVLRTGQPGQAPERKVIVEYDINDYKEKTELTSQKLFTLMYSSLRSYRDILTIDRNKTGLQKIINSSPEIFSRQSTDHFNTSALEQLTSLILKDDSEINSEVSRMLLAKQDGMFKVLSAIGQYKNTIGKYAENVLDDSIVDVLNQCLSSKSNIYLPCCFVAYFSSHTGEERLVFFSGGFELSEIDQHLVDLYIKQVAISFDNLTLNKKVEAGQQEIVNLLGTSIETRSKETGNHIKRVAAFSAIFAKHVGLDELATETLTLASPLHDIGKIGIPDAILNKPGTLDKDEWQVMMTHSAIGYEMLARSESEILQAGAIISHEHHEKWDGSGYPNNKKGEEIHIFGRITAVADVFDALAGERCYKKAWPMEDIVTFFKDQRGLHFEPRLVDILFDNLEQFVLVLETYKD